MGVIPIPTHLDAWSNSSLEPTPLVDPIPLVDTTPVVYLIQELEYILIYAHEHFFTTKMGKVWSIYETYCLFKQIPVMEQIQAGEPTQVVEPIPVVESVPVVDLTPLIPTPFPVA